MDFVMDYVPNHTVQQNECADSEIKHFDCQNVEITPEVLKDIDFTTSFETKIGTSITTFDVSDSNILAVGFNNGRISIYDENAAFTVALNIDNSGGVYYVDWDGEYLDIYILRKLLSVKVSLDGQVHSVCKIPDTYDNYKYWNELRNRESSTVNGITYEKSEFSIIQRDSDETIKMIVSTNDEVKSIKQFSAFLVFFFLCLLLLIIGICFIGTKDNKRKLK